MESANLIITFRNMEPSPAFEEKARKLLAKLNKILDSENEPKVVELVLESQPVRMNHEVSLRIKSPNYDLYIKRESSDLYLMLDQVIDAMHHELIKAKDKRVDRDQSGIHRPG